MIHPEYTAQLETVHPAVRAAAREYRRAYRAHAISGNAYSGLVVADAERRLNVAVKHFVDATPISARRRR